MPLLDTSVAIEMRDHSGSALDRLTALEGPLALSVISLVELEGGVHAQPALASLRRRRIDAMLERIALLPFDRECVAGYGRIVAAAGFSRRKIVDRMIAATALTHGLTLVTLNGDDFRDVPGLKLEGW